MKAYTIAEKKDIEEIHVENAFLTKNVYDAHRLKIEYYNESFGFTKAFVLQVEMDEEDVLNALRGYSKKIKVKVIREEV